MNDNEQNQLRQLAAEQPDAAALTLAANPIGQMLEAVVARGVTAENVAALDKLADLYERMEARNAEKAFASAFVALQRDLPVIVATSEIPNRGKYERFEDVMRVVGPLLAKHGFSVSFSMEPKDNRITETCHLTHTAGFTRSNSFTVRVGGRADSDTQADCKAATTAKRNALLNALNIVIRQDVFQEEDDVRNDGAFITWEQVEYLRELVKSTGSDEAAFLKFAGAAKYEDIGENRYPQLVAALNRKAKAGGVK
jgi:hypothetical protein